MRAKVRGPILGAGGLLDNEEESNAPAAVTGKARARDGRGDIQATGEQELRKNRLGEPRAQHFGSGAVAEVHDPKAAEGKEDDRGGAEEDAVRAEAEQQLTQDPEQTADTEAAAEVAQLREPESHYA